MRHATHRLIDLEMALRRAESTYCLKQQALERLEDECKGLRRAYVDGTFATLYFRQALDLEREHINPSNDTLLIPITEQSVRRYHSSKCALSNWIRLLTISTKDCPLIFALSL